MAHGTFHWNELMTRDPEAAKSFLSDTLGWRFDAFPVGKGQYWVAMMGEQPVGGVMDIGDDPDMGTMAEHWMSYIEVDDVDARLQKVSAAGGHVLHEPFDVPEVGRIAMIADPAGAVVGWITPTERSNAA